MVDALAGGERAARHAGGHEHAARALLEKARDGAARARLRPRRRRRRRNSSLADLHEARALSTRSPGARPRDEVLRAIFERFCIGK